jgi:acetylornithine deacetylase/succinyl-diaminopimelate desuccinylase-like protein
MQRYLRIDTTNPPGDVRPAVAFFSEIFRAAGIEHRMFAADEAAGKVNLLARLRGSGAAKPILLLNHLDVVPVEAEKWTRPAFSGDIADGCVWGRGALDMKSMGIAELMAMLQLAANRVPLARDVLWLGVCDEEIGGGLGARWMCEHHYGELAPEFVLDEGGGGSRGLLAPPDRVVFSPTVNEKQPLWLRLTVQGTGGHGSMPEGDSAIEILHAALGRLLAARADLERADDHPIVDEMRRRLGRLPANRFTNAITRHTIVITSVQSGVGDPPPPNVIPSEATATIDCRLLPDTPVASMLERIRAALGDPRVRVEVTYQPSEPGPTSSHRTALFEAIEAVVKERFPKALVTPSLLTGGTDSRFFRAKGAVAYGFEPMILTPPEMDLIHGHDERIPVDQLERMVGFLYDVVRRLAQDPAGPASSAATRSAGTSRPRA